MKIKKFLIVFLIATIMFTVSSSALVTSNVYTQGIYSISEINPFNATVKLVNPNIPTSLSIVDSNGNQKFYNRFDAQTEIVNIGPINNADMIAIVVKGELAITFTKD